MSRDPAHLPSLEVFAPERHLRNTQADATTYCGTKCGTGESLVGSATDDPSEIVFGFGRRQVAQLCYSQTTVEKSGRRNWLAQNLPGPILRGKRDQVDCGATVAKLRLQDA